MNLIWRAVYRFYRVMWLLLHWAHRRFTLAGWLVLAGCALTGLGILDTETSSAYQGFALLLFLLAAAFVFQLVFSASFYSGPVFAAVRHCGTGFYLPRPHPQSHPSRKSD